MLFILFALLVASPAATAAPDAGTLPTDDSVRLFLDCGHLCDFDYLRTEIPYVDWVRDRQDADVHVIVAARTTGAGGQEYTLRFIGLRSFSGREEEMHFTTLPAQSPDLTRRAMARVLRAGLVPYLMRTPIAERLQITVIPDESGAETEARARDPWNSWVFRMSANSFFSGESSFRQVNLNGSVSASRITEDWKTTLSTSTFYAQSFFDLGGGHSVTSERQSYGFNGLVVRSLTGHLSAGIRASVNHSTFENRDLGLRVAPAVEYNIFPYDESTRRQLTLQYSVGANHVDYIEETIYFRDSESLLDHSLQAALSLRQPWGTISTSLTGSQYLHDLSHYRVVLGGGVQLRLVRGLSLNLSGSAARIRDQLHIQRGTLTEEEILLRQRQLETTFYYFGSVGLSFSFGSIYSTVVNPRFTTAPMVLF